MLTDKKGDKTMIKRFTATGLFEVVEKKESDRNAICAGEMQIGYHLLLVPQLVFR
ncbi:hypothetical protein [Arsenophonus endosymbiont of Aleurodicus floccissimus]|uniref:hypothetical protein n=1 Tax=Arsenophonus endosymbiont of Aleurodicus floccissimus TaxID=2152761 RepID=UPI001600F7F8|nr:hypothetical protein [Arsenophonus endosymbiont of Aleurodicus floccissimus]